MTKWSHNKLVLADIMAMEPIELYSQLLGICLENRYKFGWAYHKFLLFRPESELPRPRPQPKSPMLKLREAVGIMNYRRRMKDRREELKRHDHSLITNEPGPALKDQVE